MSRVLVVDDEKSIRTTLCEFLKRDGFEADSADDAYLAFQLLEDNDYDVVVTDIVMPKVSGMEMLTEIRKITKSLQVIIMTGEPSVSTAIRAVQSEANDYLIKPINKDVFLNTVRRAANVKKLIDEKAALELENFRYQRELEDIVEKRTQSLQNATQSIIYLLSSVVEVRDPYTAGHQRRVGNLSAAIADKLKMDKQKIETIRTIGYIHDIGKIVIPAEILSKPGKLTNLEFDMIKTHAFAGYEMLSKVSLPDIIAQTIYQHHERYNGSGYPRGISDADMTDEARIIIVADVVEAMMSHRPYRAALGIEAALSEIEKNSGILYNPEIVSACKSLFIEDEFNFDDKQHPVFIPL